MGKAIPYGLYFQSRNRSRESAGKVGPLDVKT